MCVREQRALLRSTHASALLDDVSGVLPERAEAIVDGDVLVEAGGLIRRPPRPLPRRRRQRVAEDRLAVRFHAEWTNEVCRARASSFALWTQRAPGPARMKI